MNKVILMGRLTRDPQVRYTQGQDSMAIARFTLAVDRRGRKQEGQQDADLIAEDIEFAESKAAAEGSGGAGGHQKPEQTENDGFMNIPEGIDEELPFN